ncbi:MAG: hypothetical protein ABR968_08560 [Bacteroidales bacterium]|jgi:hypothetical protein
MQKLETNKTSDFTVFRQVLRGIFNPLTVSKSTYRSAFSLVRSANTNIVCSAPTKEEALNSISSSDLTLLGYYSNSDMDISFSQDTGLKTYQAVIKPKVVYSLNEDISLPDPPDERANYYLDFFADELERIKIRAEKNLVVAPSEKKVRSYSYCNYQLLDKLFHESRIYFNTLSTKSNSKVNPSDLYIIYILNLFIIRSLVFYYKFFKPYLDIKPISEESLRLTFQKEIPRILKYPWLFIQRPPLYEVLNDSPTQACEVNPSYQKAPSSEKPEIPDTLLKEALEMIQLKGCIKLNCNKNKFLAEIYKMRYDKDPDGKTIFSAERKKLLQLLSFIVTDEEGNPLNPSTINTVTKPSNIKKRPGK